jgi:hypothetical protein
MLILAQIEREKANKNPKIQAEIQQITKSVFDNSKES